jgi:hypothetical protein
VKSLFSGQVPKEPSFSEANEDVFRLALEMGRVALSDGASESFDSKTWASVLTSRFVQRPAMTERWLEEAVAEYLAQFDTSTLSWSKQAAFERGSFATLLGIEDCTEHSTVDVLAVGDSLAIFLDQGAFLDSFPYIQADEFKQRPELFSTKAALNSFFSKDFFSRHIKTWSISGKPEPVLLCMTDALGEWALRHQQDGSPVWSDLLEIRKVQELEDLVLHERQAKNMRVDDTTLLILSFQATEQE